MCGDGTLNITAGEECDDGNTVDGDGCSATCTIEAAGAFMLTVIKNGGGTGTVTSNPTGIVCGATCLASFDADVQVVLVPVPDGGFFFSHWEGCDAGGDFGIEGCQVTMNQNKQVTVFFE